MTKRSVILALVVLFIFQSPCLWAGTSDEVIKSLADSLSKAIDASGKKKVSVLDFKDLKDDTTGFGRAAAEDLSIDLVTSVKKFAVLDRANLKEILKEMRIGEAGLVNPATAQKFGQLSGVDALIVGQVIDGEDEVSVRACKKIT